MRCCGQKETGTLEAVLEFTRKSLLYDIGNYLYIEGSAMDRGTDVHNRHLVQDGTEEGNSDRITRVLNLAHARAVEMLYPYSKQEVTEPYRTECCLPEPNVYEILMRVPETFSQTTLDYLEKLVREWLVATAVSDWLSLTLTPRKAVWDEKISELESEIRSIINLRRSRLTRRMHPF